MKNLFITFFVLLLILPIQAQDITNKLGGNTANDTYDIIDSNDNLLFQVQGNGKVGIGTAGPLSKLSVGGTGNSVWTIYGASGITSGIGVYGHATEGGGTGVYGYAPGPNATGVYGEGAMNAGYFKGAVTITGKTWIGSLNMSTGAVAGEVLKTDGSGNASWEPEVNVSTWFSGRIYKKEITFDIGVTGAQTLSLTLNCTDANDIALSAGWDFFHINVRTIKMNPVNSNGFAYTIYSPSPSLENKVYCKCLQID